MDKSLKQMMIDPPEGWRYGFPKPVPQDVMKSETLLRIWLAGENYPEVDLAMKHSRYWEVDDES